MPKNGGAHRCHDASEHISVVGDLLRRVNIGTRKLTQRRQGIDVGRHRRRARGSFLRKPWRQEKPKKHALHPHVWVSEYARASDCEAVHTCFASTSAPSDSLAVATDSTSMYKTNKLRALAVPLPAATSTFTCLTTPATVTTSPGTHASTMSALSSHSTVRGMRPGSGSSSSASCSLRRHGCGASRIRATHQCVHGSDDRYAGSKSGNCAQGTAGTGPRADSLDLLPVNGARG